MSNTTSAGNSFRNVWETIRKVGLVSEQDWPMPTQNFDSQQEFWNEYYKEIPKAIKDKALKFLDLFDIKYEWVLNGTMNTDALKKGLEQSPIQIGTPVCLPGWNNQNVPVCVGAIPSHGTMLYRIEK